MGAIWKTVLTVAVILVITAVGTTIMTANVEVLEAGDYIEEVTTMIRASNYSPEIIKVCKAQAQESGYRLDVTVYSDGNTASGEKYARICLNYPYRLLFMKSYEWKQKEKII